MCYKITTDWLFLNKRVYKGDNDYYIVQMLKTINQKVDVHTDWFKGDYLKHTKAHQEL